MLSGLACQINAGGPKSPRHVPVSAAAASSAEKVIGSAFNSRVAAGPVAFTLTEEQVTSYLSAQLSTQEGALIKQPQVILQNNQVEIYGLIEQEYLAAYVRMVFKANQSASDRQLELVSADFGPLQVKSGLEGMTDLLNEMLDGSATAVATGFRIESIYVADRMITITARKF